MRQSGPLNQKSVWVKPPWAIQTEISISLSSCQASSDVLVYCHPLSIPWAPLLNERQQVFTALHKNVPAIGWDKTLYLVLSCLSHLACFQEGLGQAGVCFMWQIDTWARALTQMLDSLCTGANKTTRRSLSLPETKRGGGRCCWRALGVVR